MHHFERVKGIISREEFVKPKTKLYPEESLAFHLRLLEKQEDVSAVHGTALNQSFNVQNFCFLNIVQDLVFSPVCCLVILSTLL